MRIYISNHAKSELYWWSAANAHAPTHAALGKNRRNWSGVPLRGYSLTGITKMRWGSSNGSVAIAGYRLFRKARLGSWGGRVTQYVRKQQERMEMWRWAFAVVCLVKKQPFSGYWKDDPPVHMPWSLQEAWTSPVWAKRQHSSTQAAREVSGARPQQPPDTGDWGPNAEKTLLDLVLASQEDRVRKEKVWGSERRSVCLFQAQTSKEQQVSGIQSPA